MYDVNKKNQQIVLILIVLYDINIPALKHKR